MHNYLQPQTIGDVLRNTFVIYGRNFVAILLIYLLPILPLQLFQLEAKSANNTALYIAAYIAGIVAGLFAFGAIAVAVSDICLGNKPRVVRSYGKVFNTTGGKLLVTNCLVVLCWGIPALPLFIFPARLGNATANTKMAMVIAMIVSVIVVTIIVLRLLFSCLVVVLEGLWAVKALERSVALVRGFNWRNFAVAVLLWVIVLVSWVAIITPFTLLHVKSMIVTHIFMAVIAVVTLPLFFIAAVLLYYDSRVRNEAYDNAALAEDLRR
jgi:hypothetical protein